MPVPLFNDLVRQNSYFRFLSRMGQFEQNEFKG